MVDFREEDGGEMELGGILKNIVMSGRRKRKKLKRWVIKKLHTRFKKLLVGLVKRREGDDLSKLMTM